MLGGFRAKYPPTLIVSWMGSVPGVGLLRSCSVTEMELPGLACSTLISSRMRSSVLSCKGHRRGGMGEGAMTW